MARLNLCFCFLLLWAAYASSAVKTRLRRHSPINGMNVIALHVSKFDFGMFETFGRRGGGPANGGLPLIGITFLRWLCRPVCKPIRRTIQPDNNSRIHTRLHIQRGGLQAAFASRSPTRLRGPSPAAPVMAQSGLWRALRLCPWRRARARCRGHGCVCVYVNGFWRVPLGFVFLVKTTRGNC